MSTCEFHLLFRRDSARDSSVRLVGTADRADLAGTIDSVERGCPERDSERQVDRFGAGLASINSLETGSDVVGISYEFKPLEGRLAACPGASVNWLVGIFPRNLAAGHNLDHRERAILIRDRHRNRVGEQFLDEIAFGGVIEKKPLDSRLAG